MWLVIKKELDWKEKSWRQHETNTVCTSISYLVIMTITVKVKCQWAGEAQSYGCALPPSSTHAFPSLSTQIKRVVFSDNSSFEWVKFVSFVNLSRCWGTVECLKLATAQGLRKLVTTWTEESAAARPGVVVRLGENMREVRYSPDRRIFVNCCYHGLDVHSLYAGLDCDSCFLEVFSLLTWRKTVV